MDGTQDAPRERVSEGLGESVDPEAEARRQRTIIRRVSWTLAWGVPAVALVVGIALTVNGTTEVWTPLGDDTYDVTLRAIWPAGLVLLAVGALGVTAAAIATALITTGRKHD